MGEPSRLLVGRIGRAHGLRGEVSVALDSDRVERLAPGARLYAGERALTVVSARPHQRRWLVLFEGVGDRDAAESLRGLDLEGDPLPSAPEDMWVHELVGCEVRDPGGAVLGTVSAVEANPASDLLVLEDGTLIPLQFLVEQGGGWVVVDPPDGLLELNR
ncbi:MAG TPA: ribosome maturation factor RimM [Acidimicrobiia bacterium]|jgi:16S rRNA processing protein RimM